MSEHKSICIVWPAWFEGSTDPELHVTALFLGKTTDLNGQSPSRRAAIQDVVSAFSNIAPGPISLQAGIDWFGRNKDVPVLRLYSMFNPALRYTRDVMAEHLYNLGIEANDDYGFIPHVTMAREQITTMKLPRIVYLEPPVLWYGDDRAVHSNHQQKEAA
jgi:2'-5' RNA ligase